LHSLLFVDTIDATDEAQEGGVGGGQVVVEACDDVVPPRGLSAAKYHADSDGPLPRGSMGGRRSFRGMGFLPVQQGPHAVHLGDGELGLEVGEEKRVGGTLSIRMEDGGGREENGAKGRVKAGSDFALAVVKPLDSRVQSLELLQGEAY